MNQVRTALIGAGWMGSALLQRLSERTDVEVAAVVDRKGGSAGQTLAALKLSHVPVHDELAKVTSDPSIHAVVIATPNAFHGAQAIAAMTAGKHVFCEKPCATRFHEFVRQIELEKANPKLITFVDYLMNFDPMEQRLQQFQRHTVLQERAKQRKKRRIESAKKAAQAKCAVIKPTKGRLAKAMLHHSVTDSFKKELNTIHRDYQDDWHAIYAKGKQAIWYDWLKAKAWEGNAEALEVLRHRYDRAPVRSNAIAGVAADRVNVRAGAKIEAVTKRGTLHHQVAQTVLRDDGKLFRLSEHTSQEVVETALTMAVHRFGRQLAITGTEAFRQQTVTAGAKLNVVFSDPALERQRLALIASNANNHPPENTQGAIRSRGRRM